MNTQIASDLERICLSWLDKRGITDYEFQSSQMGGRFELGGAIVDFLFSERALAWRVQGDYFHQGVEKEGTDAIQRELLESQGWTVIDIYGSDLDTPERINNTLTRALRGEEVI